MPKRSHGRSPDKTQISISIDKSLLAEIDEAAKEDNRNRSNYIVETVRKRLERRRAENALRAGAPKTNPESFPSTAVSARQSITSLNEPPANTAVPHSDAAPTTPRMTKNRAALRKVARSHKPDASS